MRMPAIQATGINVQSNWTLFNKCIRVILCHHKCRQIAYNLIKQMNNCIGPLVTSPTRLSANFNQMVDIDGMRKHTRTRSRIHIASIFN